MMATNRTLLEQARELQALAQTGLMYCKDPFDRERYERIRAMAVDMLSTQVDAPAGQVSRLLSAGYRRNSTLVRPSSMKKAGSS